MTERKPGTVGVCMDVMINGWFDNGSSTLRSHVSRHRMVPNEDSGIWTPQWDDYWQRNVEIFASPHVEMELAAATMKALTRYSEAMCLGDFLP